VNIFVIVNNKIVESIARPMGGVCWLFMGSLMPRLVGVARSMDFWWTETIYTL